MSRYMEGMCAAYLRYCEGDYPKNISQQEKEWWLSGFRAFDEKHIASIRALKGLKETITTEV